MEHPAPAPAPAPGVVPPADQPPATPGGDTPVGLPPAPAPLPAPAPAPAPPAPAGPTADYALCVTAGLGAGFAPAAPPGSLVVADAIVAADLGAETPDGFLDVTELGFGHSVHLPPAELAARAAEATGALLAPVLTVSTVTGTAERAAELAARHPMAGAEAMEGFGVAEAAAAHGLPVLEVRAVSNAVGPRDRAAWRIGDALGALTDGFRVLGPVLANWGERHEHDHR
ncbi:futalosine hydrolase [Streptomyces sp. NPDC059538]|uniref:futalosine hydrolase n=1 Tax=Streptomyces sp. NPDC059538 TaxID=3346860 RepID=UPI0036BB8B98